jgi:hypothetical protein
MSHHVYNGETYCFTPFCLSVWMSHFCERNSYISRRIWLKLGTKQDDDAIDVHEVRIFLELQSVWVWGAEMHVQPNYYI